MNYSFLITSSRQDIERHIAAIDLAKEITKDSSNKLSVFFWQDAVDVALSSVQTPRNEFNPMQAWQSLALSCNIELTVCIASALRRGVINEQEAKRHGIDSATASTAFTIDGLGALISARSQADRNLQF